MDLHERRVDGRDTVPGGIAMDGDTAYVVGREGAAIVSIPLIDGRPGRSKLGQPYSRAFPASAPAASSSTGGADAGTLQVSYLDRDESPVRARTHRGHP